MISKMKPIEEGGGRIAVVFNGSPLFTGAAGSGESEIRRWIIENDWLEAVVALPDQLFYNTGISTYFWIVTNRKSPERRGKVQLVDGRQLFTKMRKSLGEKRKEISSEQVDEITRLYAEFRESETVKIFPNETFGYMRITVERPLRSLRLVTPEGCDRIRAISELAELHPRLPEYIAEYVQQWSEMTFGETPDDDQPGHKLLGRASQLAGEELGDELLRGRLLALKPATSRKIEKKINEALTEKGDDYPVQVDKHGNVIPDSDLRDTENVPLPAVTVEWEADVNERLETTEYRSAVNEYVTAEVHPYAPDAWIDYDKTKIGYEIPLTRHFYKYVAPRPLAEIDAEIKQLEAEIQELLRDVAE